jgi:hypothetical protein
MTFIHSKSILNSNEIKLEIDPIVIINSWRYKGLKGGNGQLTNGKVIVNYDEYFVSIFKIN